jgi:zinc protease
MSEGRNRQLRDLIAVLLALFALSRCTAQPQPIFKHTLPNGVRVILQNDANSDFVAICVFIRAGVAEEEGMIGVGRVVAYSLFGSNINQSRESVRRALFLVGGSLETVWNPDYTLITCVTTRAAFDDAVWSIGQAIKNAEIDRETLEAARRSVQQEASIAAADPFKVAYGLLRQRLHSESPYHQPFFPSAEALRRITREMAYRFYQTRYTPQNTVVSIVGNISSERALRVVENQMIDFNRPENAYRRRRAAPEPSLPTETVVVRHRMPATSTLLLAGMRAPGVTEADYPAFSVLTSLIGGGKSSRLFRAVRDTQGIGYRVGAYTPPLAKGGHLLAFVEFDSSQARAGKSGLTVGEVERTLRDTIRSVIHSPPDQREVERAKRYTMGTHALAHQRVRDRAFYLGWYESIGAGYVWDEEFARRVGEVSVEDVRRVAERYLRAMAVVVVEPEK